MSNDKPYPYKVTTFPPDDATCGACHGTGYLRGFLNEEGHLVLTGREGDETICTQCGGPALVPRDDMVEYGHCPVCGAEPGQQCSVPDPEQPNRGIEYASRVHARRE